ncbi:MAG: hypothetical protein ACOY46_03115 [Bacillota bacterium]
MKNRLAEHNREYEKILHSDLNNYEKSMKYGQLMTIMEKEFQIPMLRNIDFEKKNPAAISLYRKISMSRNI